jgi:hypothetical protein
VAQRKLAEIFLTQYIYQLRYGKNHELGFDANSIGDWRSNQREMGCTYKNFEGVYNPYEYNFAIT